MNVLISLFCARRAKKGTAEQALSEEILEHLALYGHPADLATQLCEDLSIELWPDDDDLGKKEPRAASREGAGLAAMMLAEMAAHPDRLAAHAAVLIDRAQATGARVPSLRPSSVPETAAGRSKA